MDDPKVGDFKLKMETLPIDVKEPNGHILYVDDDFFLFYLCQVFMGLKIESASVMARHPSPNPLKVAEVESRLKQHGLEMELIDQVQDDTCPAVKAYNNQLYVEAMVRQLMRVSPRFNRRSYGSYYY